MAADRRKGLQAAERLLKQGKLQAALTELRRVSESAPNDLLTMNRLGDLLARQGRPVEAVEYYSKIAEQFARGGFLPKAIAIHKKILRLDPQNVDSMIDLGELYITQNLVGEARSYLLHAANQCLQSQDFARAREVYERLVEAQPDDIRHQVRLAETRAAEGDTQGAMCDLLAIGRAMLDSGNPAEAEKIFQRAGEIEGASPEPLVGLATCLTVQGRSEEALAMLEEAARGERATPALIGELALRYEMANRSDRAIELLSTTSVLEIPHPTWQQIFRCYIDRGKAERLWEIADPLFQKQVSSSDPQPLVHLLEELSELEAEGHVPALQRLLEWQEKRGDSQGTVKALEWLVRAYQARSMHDEASLMVDRLREVAPMSPLVADGGSPATPSAAPETPAAASAETATESAPTDLPADAEAPAVPLNRADEEFVAGRLTQAEVLEKYGLRPQALEQVEEVTSKFPGHVESQELRVSMLRSGGEPARLAESLVHLAVALRAGGDASAARQAAGEAVSIGTLDERATSLLASLSLLEAPEPVHDVAAESAGSDVLIDLDGDDADEPDAPAFVVEPTSVEVPAAVEAPAAVATAPAATVAAPAAPTGAGPTRVPSPDMIEEIRGFVAAGDHDGARARIEALGVLGYASDELAAITSEISGGVAAAPAAPEVPVETAPPVESPVEADVPIGSIDAPATADIDLDAPVEIDEDDDLSAITAALESELFEDDAKPLVPEEDPEQSLDEIFAAFKDRVSAEVDGDDHRTHYDLGIAYKEMGLTDEAIHEFEIAAKATDLHREACSMIAMCHRDRSDIPQAVRWYREAIASPGEAADNLAGIRYDLAEVLLQSGDAEGALDEFRDVLKADPGYRDVQGRISELEGRLES